MIEKSNIRRIRHWKSKWQHTKMKDVPRKKKHANSTYMKKVLNFYKCEDIKHIYVMW